MKSIVEKKTNIRRQRREQLQQELREQRQAQQSSASPPKQPKEQAAMKENEPLKQVEPNNTANAPLSPPVKSMPPKHDASRTVAFGRTTTKVSTPPKPASRLGHVRRYSLENDNVSLVILSHDGYFVR